MEAIKKLMERVNNTKLSIEERYPEINATQDGRKNILFISPMLNKQGLYRMILPALELAVDIDGVVRYNTIINEIIPDDHTKIIDDFYIKIIPELIRWADYMVFPANGLDLTAVIQNFKDINPKVKVVMDVDRNYRS